MMATPARTMTKREVVRDVMPILSPRESGGFRLACGDLPSLTHAAQGATTFGGILLPSFWHDNPSGRVEDVLGRASGFEELACAGRKNGVGLPPSRSAELP